jgi:thiamine transport system substrate-binding protein
MRWGKSSNIVLGAALGLALAGVLPAAGAARVLRVLTHSSFSATKGLVEEFERENGAEVRFTSGGDAGETLNKAILAGARPLADVIFGVDNTFMSRALAAGMLEPYDSPRLAEVPAELLLDPTRRLLPIDVGHVCLNYDRAWFARTGLAVPRSLEDLLRPEYRDLLVVEDPATSSPGLAFLLATIARFGEKGPVTWESWWTGLRANGVLVVNGWNEAYYDEFSGAGKGKRPLVVSYSTSPAAEVFFASEPKPAQPPTGVVLAPGSSFRQVEFAGIFRGAREKDLARKFVDFMLSRRFQEDIPLQMFVYPANRTARVPDLFERFAPVPPEPALIDPALIEANREQWIARWSRLVLR